MLLWGLPFFAPLMSAYFQTMNTPDVSFTLDLVRWQLKVVGVYGVIFLIHNVFLAPLLVYKKKRVLYLSLVMLLFAVFLTYRYYNPVRMKSHHHKEWRHDINKNHIAKSECKKLVAKDLRVYSDSSQKKHHGMFTIGNMIGCFLFIMVILGNLGAKFAFKSYNDEILMKAQTQEHLEQQLKYLRYQINPHFLMNTLNNIHALVDIDTAKAQDMILRLSKLFRFMLYDGSKDRVHLKSEMDFLRGYVDLMSMRYSEDKVKVNFEETVSNLNVMVPPLLFVNFMENAFVHGVSYQRETFIDVKIVAEADNICFTCTNSKKNNEEPTTHGGVGECNALKRLGLIYGDRYVFNKVDAEDTYTVELAVPMEKI